MILNQFSKFGNVQIYNINSCHLIKTIMLSDQNFRMNSDRSELIKALIKENMGGPRMGAV